MRRLIRDKRGGAGTELIGIVLVVTFLFTFAFLVGSLPFSPDYDAFKRRKVVPPTFFETEDLADISDRINFTITSWAYQYIGYSLGGYDWNLNSFVGHIELSTKDYSWFIWQYESGATRYSFMTPEGLDRGDQVSDDEILMDFDSTKNYTKYRCYVPSDPKRGATIYFGYNTTAWPNIKKAYYENDLWFAQTLAFNQTNMAPSAWNIVGSLLMFQPITGLPYEVGMLISVPLWTLIAYLIFRLVTSLIPFLGD